MKMKKKIISVILMVILCLDIVIPTFAASTDGFADEYYRLNDLADVLTDNEENELLAQLDELSVRQKVDVTIAIVDELESYDTVTEYADDFYEFCNYGYGQNKDGVLLLISMENHDWAISTCGYGVTAFTDAGIHYIGQQMKDDLAAENYASALNTYVKLCDMFITQARNGEPFDKDSLPKEALSLIWIPISVIIGVVLALIIVGVMKSKLKTVALQSEANNYMRKDSLSVRESSDLFLYHTVTRTEKKKDNDSGSSTHTSSSGTTHGGGSGKF